MNSMKQFYSNTTDETDVKFNKINDLYNEKSLKLRIVSPVVFISCITLDNNIK